MVTIVQTFDHTAAVLLALASTGRPVGDAVAPPAADAPYVGPKARRVLRRLVVSQETGCWLWQGATTHLGYGFIGVKHVPQSVHRVLYEEFVGAVPQGLELDHLCRTPSCCNPAHLEAVSHRENVLRGTCPAAQNARKTHCKRGHEFTLANTYTVPGTAWRQCRVCNLIRESRRGSRKG